MAELDTFENELIDAFKGHPVLRAAPALRAADFRAVLLQRRFLSLAFTPAYDLAIDLLGDREGRQIVRVILREEYPDPTGLTPSHREDMKEDLLALGVTPGELLETRPTAATTQAIVSTLTLMAKSAREDHADIRLLTILRFWGEILVSAEYEALWPRMRESLAVGGENRSRFYYPHLVHDQKKHPFTAAAASAATHADLLGARLAGLIASDAAAKSFMAAEEASLALKTGFYDQFLGTVPRP